MTQTIHPAPMIQDTAMRHIGPMRYIRSMRHIGPLLLLTLLLLGPARVIAQTRTHVPPSPPNAGEQGPQNPQQGRGGQGQTKENMQATPASGRYLTGLARRVELPLTGRMTHVILRQALLNASDKPDMQKADWTAERAMLLLRTGAARRARTLISTVDRRRYTSALYEVAIQTSLALADVPALCPLAPTASALFPQHPWAIYAALCADVVDDELESQKRLDALEEDGQITQFDAFLARHLVDAVQSGAPLGIVWSPETPLTLDRFALAVASGNLPPRALVDAAPTQLHSWLFRSPGIPLQDRMFTLETMVRLGLVPADELPGLYAAESNDLGPQSLSYTPAGHVRTAFAGATAEDRLIALQSLWEQSLADQTRRMSLFMVTAKPAAQFPVSAQHVDAAPKLIAAMLTGGHIDGAMRWWPLIAQQKDDLIFGPSWAMLVLVDPTGQVPVTSDAFDRWRGSVALRQGEEQAKQRAARMMALLAGLGHGDKWANALKDAGIPPLEDIWTRRLAAAAKAQQRDEVALLTALALQGSWSDIPPQQLMHILAAWRMVGWEQEARLLAVEALRDGA